MSVDAQVEFLEVPVGDGLLGRVVDALGTPIDGKEKWMQPVLNR